MSSDALVNPWRLVLELDASRKVCDGKPDALVDAIRGGADLRVLTEFIHNEHIDPDSDNDELVREVCDFQITYLLDDRWVAGIMQLRQPIDLPVGFGVRPSMSYFLYNQDGEQAIARPYLDGQTAVGQFGPTPVPDHAGRSKFVQHDNWDDGTNAPSRNFIYDFEVFRYIVRDDWHQVLEHDDTGDIMSGSVDALADAFTNGRQVKLGVRGLCNNLTPNSENKIDHEVFIHASSCYYYTDQKLFIAATNPLIRVRPAIPLQYTSQAWDITWLMARTDGITVHRRVNPYTLKFDELRGHYAMRWFVG